MDEEPCKASPIHLLNESGWDEWKSALILAAGNYRSDHFQLLRNKWMDRKTPLLLQAETAFFSFEQQLRRFVCRFIVLDLFSSPVQRGCSNSHSLLLPYQQPG